MSKLNKLVAVALLSSLAGLASGSAFEPCVPGESVMDTRPLPSVCEAQNAVFESLGREVDALIEANSDFQMYARGYPQNLDKARDAFKDGVEPLAALVEAAEADMAKAAELRGNGSAQMASLLADLRPQFVAQGLPSPSSLDNAADLIASALANPAQQNAGVVLADYALSWGVMRSQSLVKSLASSAGAEASRGEMAAAEERRKERYGQSENAGYFSNAASRFALLGQMLPFYTIGGLLLGGFVGMRKGRPRLILKAPALGFVLALGTGLINTLLPLPQWVLLLIAAGAGYFLWQYTERFWPTAAAQVATHGSARWANLADLVRFKRLDQPRDFALGRAQFNTNGADSRFRYMGHVMTCAPTGSGKGIGAVIPNLLEYPGSALVLDIKGENYAVTGQAREAMGHKVYVLDPFGVTDRADAFNWLAMLDVNSPDVVAQASGLADMLVVSEKAGDHWDETAKELLRGLLVHVASLPADRAHMGELRRLITGPADELDALLVDMAASDVGYGVVARAANAFLAKADKERSGVLSSVIRHTAFLDDPRVAASLRRSSFDLSRIKTERMTIFVVIPPARLAANTRYMRGFIGLAFEALTRTADKPADRVAFFLDEFAQLGYMKPIEDAVGLLRGYGVAFWFFLQDLSQLKAVYPKWQTFLANSAQQYFGTNDFDTAKYISDMLGQSTIQYSTEGHSRQDAKPLGGSSTSDSQHYHGRNLLTPDEVIRLGPQQPLVFVPGEPPYKLRRLDYLSDPAYSAKAQPNPYHG